MNFAIDAISASSSVTNNAPEDRPPQYLYKIVSREDWKASQGAASLVLPADDSAFIHFSKEDQYQRIIDKYWGNVPEFYLLKIDSAKVPGTWRYEANPGNTSKYYHLYNGSIPLEAVASFEIMRNPKVHNL